MPLRDIYINNSVPIDLTVSTQRVKGLPLTLYYNEVILERSTYFSRLSY